LINPKALVLGTNSSKKINVPTKSKPVRVTFDKSDFNRKGAEKYSQIFGGIKNITFELEPTADKKKSKNA
jgi:hypothetical protein